MPDRWSWDFEDEPPAPPHSARAAPRPAPAGAPAAHKDTARPGGGARPNRLHVRRRRAVALAVVLVLLVAVVAAAAGSHAGPRHPSASRSRTLSRATPKPPSDPEREQEKAVGSVLAYTPFVKEGSSRRPDIALTFDDGPGPYTPQVLSVLEQYRVKATFFVIGKMLRYFSSSTVREIDDGDVIGDHTESHPMMAQLSAHDQYEELFEQIARIELLGGKRPTLFRPPYGSFNATTFEQLKRLHLLMTLWSIDTGDYEQPGVSVIVQRALENIHAGEIILLHDAGGVRTQTVQALPLIIKALRAKGYELVTVPKLLLDDPPPPGQPLPTSLAGD